MNIPQPLATAQVRDSRNLRDNLARDYDLSTGINQIGRSNDGRTKNMEGASTRQGMPDRHPPAETLSSGKVVNGFNTMLPPVLPFATERAPSPIPTQSSRPSMLVASDIPKDILSPPKRHVPEEVSDSDLFLGHLSEFFSDTSRPHSSSSCPLHKDSEAL